MANLSDKLERIELAVDRIRTKVELPTQAIEEVATAVEEMGAGTGATDIYKVKNSEELLNIKNAQEGAYCLMLDSSQEPAKPGDTIQNFVCPDIVVLPEAVTSSISLYEGNFSISISESYADIRYRGYSSRVQIMYTTSDGKVYTKDTAHSEPSTPEVTIDEPVTLSASMNPLVGYFLISDSTSFGGIKIYSPSSMANVKSMDGKDYKIPFGALPASGVFNIIYNVIVGDNGVIEYYDGIQVEDSMAFTGQNYVFLQNGNLYLKYGTQAGQFYYIPTTYKDGKVTKGTPVNPTLGTTTLLLEDCLNKNTILTNDRYNGGKPDIVYDSTKSNELYTSNLVEEGTLELVWLPVKIGVAVKQRDVVDGIQVFCDDGVITGNLGAARTYKSNEADSDYARVNKILTAMFGTEEGADLSYLAYQNYNLGTVPIFKCVDKVKSVNHMLYHHRGIKTVDVSSFDLSPMFATVPTKVHFNQVFQGAYGSAAGGYISDLEEIIGLDKWGPQLPSASYSLNNMFSYNKKLKRVDLSTWTNVRIGSASDIDCLFYEDSALEFIDVRNLNFSTASSGQNSFTGVPSNCLIIVKNSTEKSWFASKYPSLTNVKTVAEYGA